MNAKRNIVVFLDILHNLHNYSFIVVYSPTNRVGWHLWGIWHFTIFLIGKKGGHIDIKEQTQAINDQPHQLADTTAAPPPTLSQTQSSLFIHPTVIELSSKSEVAINIESLLQSFAYLDSKLRNDFEELVKKGQIQLKEIARSACTYLGILVSSLKFTDIDELFDSFKSYYDFLNYGLLKHVTDTYKLHLSTVRKSELTQYIDDVHKFSESSQLKHIRATIKEKLQHLPASQSNQTKLVIIKLNDMWQEMTMSRLMKVFKHYFGVASDLFSHIGFEYGSIIITLLTPTTQTQYLIDTISAKKDSMDRLGIMEVAVDNNKILIREDDENNFDALLHQSVKAGDSFEVDMLLQLGADPNNKDEKGKYPVETAIEGGHAIVLQALLTGGANESKLKFEWLFPLRMALSALHLKDCENL